LKTQKTENLGGEENRSGKMTKKRELATKNTLPKKIQGDKGQFRKCFVTIKGLQLCITLWGRGDTTPGPGITFGHCLRSHKPIFGQEVPGERGGDG